MDAPLRSRGCSTNRWAGHWRLMGSAWNQRVASKENCPTTNRVSFQRADQSDSHMWFLMSPSENSTSPGQSRRRCAASLISETTAWEHHRVPSCPALPEISGFLITILQSRVTFHKSHVWEEGSKHFLEASLYKTQIFFFPFLPVSTRRGCLGGWIE